MRFMDTEGRMVERVNDPAWETFFAQGQREEESFLEKLVTPDPVSAPGHYLMLPRGALMFNLLKAYIYDVYSELGCFHLESPMVVDYAHPAVRDHAEISGEKTYHLRGQGKDLMTKIGSLYSQLELVSNNGLQDNVMPLKMFEMTRCCRIESDPQALARSCEFTMVDMHELCSDIYEAMDESRLIHQRILDLGKEFGWQFYTTFKLTDDFARENRTWLHDLVRMHGREAMLIRADESRQRPINAEYHILDKNPIEISAFQIDEHNPSKFEIRKQEGGYPVLVHANIVGSVERFMYAAFRSQDYPTWLAPEQLRVIGNRYEDHDSALDTARYLRKLGVRSTLDDRQFEREKKVELAMEDKVKYIFEYRKGCNEFLSSIVERIKYECEGKPFLRAPFPVRLSRWPEYF